MTFRDVPQAKCKNTVEVQRSNDCNVSFMVQFRSVQQSVLFYKVAELIESFQLLRIQVDSEKVERKTFKVCPRLKILYVFWDKIVPYLPHTHNLQQHVNMKKKM